MSIKPTDHNTIDFYPKDGGRPDPSEGNPFVEDANITEQPLSDVLLRQAAHRTIESDSGKAYEARGILLDKERAKRQKRRKTVVRIGKVAGGVAAAGIGLGLAYNALSNQEYGDTSPESRGELHSDIPTIVLDEGAIIRDEPHTDKSDDATWVVRTDSGAIITISDGVYVKNDGPNGDWYGVSGEDLEAAGVDLPETKDDAYFWINEQTAHAQTADTEASE